MAVMANPTNEALVRRFYQEVWNEGNVEIAGEIFAADYVRHTCAPPAPRRVGWGWPRSRRPSAARSRTSGWRSI